jgi:hypothetical protein
MGKRPESLRPDDTKVSYAPHVDLGKDPVEDVSQQVETHPGHDRLSSCVPSETSRSRSAPIDSAPFKTTSVSMDSHAVRDVTETERDRDLEEQTDGSQGIARQWGEAEAVDDRWRIGVERSLRSVVGQGDEEVDPQAPVGELRGVPCGVKF